MQLLDSEEHTMSNHNFGPLVAQYPSVIAQMPPVFGAHEFILRLAQQNQQLYVEALYAYRNTLYGGTPAPFMMVHGILATRLGEFPNLVKQVSSSVKSTDIFGNDNGCSQWQKV
jgi:hypothetical protein